MLYIFSKIKKAISIIFHRLHYVVAVLFVLFALFALFLIYEDQHYPNIIFLNLKELNSITDQDIVNFQNKCPMQLEYFISDKKIYIRCGDIWPYLRNYVFTFKNVTVKHEKSKETLIFHH